MSIIKEEWMEKADQRLAEFKSLIDAGLIHHSGDFFPSVHYPPITMYPPITQEEMFKGYTMPEDGLLDIYAHLPFCAGRCLFCHYPVMYGEKLNEKDRYMDALEKEMDIYMAQLGVDKLKARSILIGGGTPTYLTPKQLDHFLDFFCKRVDLENCTQFNYDVDPGTLVGPEGIERLKIMKSYGVDRLTIGVQSLNDDILKLMNRPHNAATAIESINNCLEMGFITNIEFIFGHPGQTLENWVEVIQQACELDVDEIQLYRLKVERYGDFQGPIKGYQDIKPELFPNVDDTIRMKQLAIECLRENGYTENLRRVFSKEKKTYSHYAHNQCCELYDEVGFGLTAFSSLRDRFVLNTQSFEEYYAAIEAGKLPMNRGYVRNKEDQVRWSMVLPLKNRFIFPKRFQELNGMDVNDVFKDKVAALREFGLLDDNPKTLRSTTLGAFVADELAEQFHSKEFIPYPEDEYKDGPLNPYKNNQI